MKKCPLIGKEDLWLNLLHRCWSEDVIIVAAAKWKHPSCACILTAASQCRIQHFFFGHIRIGVVLFRCCYRTLRRTLINTLHQRGCVCSSSLGIKAGLLNITKREQMIVHFIRPRSHARIMVLLHKNPPPTRPKDGITNTSIINPIRHRTHILRQQCSTPMNKFGEFVYLIEHPTILQISHPLGRFGIRPTQLQLDLQHSMGESCNFIICQWFLRITEPLRSTQGVIPPLRNHTQVGIKTNTDCRIKWDLERRTHILRTHRGYKLLHLDDLNHFTHECFPIIHFIGRGTFFGLHLLTLFVNGVLVVEDLFHFGFIDGKSFFDACFTCPCITMGLSFAED
mmetsp:Transcript_25003/g.49897  ORF Transcript_25003/g.49897 Transcript_25003/m.49897 type:complete len:339 (-) Transcript_25003:1085-2101(-)